MLEQESSEPGDEVAMTPHLRRRKKPSYTNVPLLGKTEREREQSLLHWLSALRWTFKEQ